MFREDKVLDGEMHLNNNMRVLREPVVQERSRASPHPGALSPLVQRARWKIPVRVSRQTTVSISRSASLVRELHLSLLGAEPNRVSFSALRSSLIRISFLLHFLVVDHHHHQFAAPTASQPLQKATNLLPLSLPSSTGTASRRDLSGVFGVCSG